jgi:hypothetical protein
MTNWFRSWHGAPTDAKWILIARLADTTPANVSAVAWALFDHASQAEDRGDVSGFDLEFYAAWAGVDDAVIAGIIGAMTDKGIIVAGRLAAWEKRQPKREDDSRERVRAHRERRAAAETEPVTDGNDSSEPVTHGNADVTHGNADVTQCNAPVTQCNDREEKSREDTEQNRNGASARARARQQPQDDRITAILNDPDVQSTAEILHYAEWVGDDLDAVTAAAARAIVLAGVEPRGAPLEAEAFVRWHSGAGRRKRTPPADWYRAWLNWLKKSRGDHHATNRGNGRATGGIYGDPVAEASIIRPTWIATGER